MTYTVTVELAPDHEFICEMTDEEKALVDKIKEANKKGKTTFSDEEFSKEEFQMLRGLMKKDFEAFSDKSKESFQQFGQDARARMEAARQSGADRMQEMRDSAAKMRKEMEARSAAARSGGGMQGALDFINAGFENKKETHETMSAQRKQHDKDLAKATEAALNGEWQVVEAHEAEQNIKDQPPVYAPGALKTETHQMNTQPEYVLQEPLQKDSMKNKPQVQPSVLDMKKARGGR